MDRLKSFQQVIALEETGNYRKAAERLGVTHSALSQAIAKLENEYGAALFVRNKRATVPTAFGRRLIEGARIALTAMGDAEREIGLMRNLEAGRLVIGADPSVSESLVGPALARLMRAYPKLHFTVLSRNWKTMEEDLEAKKSRSLYWPGPRSNIGPLRISTNGLSGTCCGVPGRSSHR